MSMFESISQQYNTMGLVRVRLWEELSKYKLNKEGTDYVHVSDNEPIKGYDLGRKELAKELMDLIKGESNGTR